MSVHQSMRLHITPEKFYLEPTDTGTNELLVIDRVTQELSLQPNEGQIPLGNVSIKIIEGLLGIIRLLAGPYLVVITKKKKVGEQNGNPVWKVASTELLSYKRTTLHMNEQQVQDNNRYLSMMEHVLSMDGFYFAYGFDLTHSLQRLNNTSPEFIMMPLHERADPRFVWNGHLLRELSSQPELASFCLPIMHGYLSITPCTIKGKSFTYTLISRRQCFRAGTRYYMRGLDLEGHAANFVETEQIMELDGNKASFVQTRGSIPLYWSQKPNLKYKPDPIMSNSQDHVLGFQSHIDSQVYMYGKQVLINLIDHKGHEDRLEKALAQAVKNSQNNNIRYESFDFHYECRKMRWHRLSILLDRVQEDQQKHGYFMVLRDGKLVCTQEGVFRTNCIDCLDRTNVVQSLLGRRSLQEQLVRLGMLLPGEQVEEQAEFEFMFKNIWADNADACARQYSGTGALKTDFTRKGKRTKLGLLKDGYNSAIRYFKNNFYDGFRQDSMDLFLGNYVVEESEGISKNCPLREERDWKYYAMPVIFLVAFSMCVISVAIPDENSSEQLMYVLFWGGASLATLGAIYYFGQEFVDKPKLVQKDKTE